VDSAIISKVAHSPFELDSRPVLKILGANNAGSGIRIVGPQRIDASEQLDSRVFKVL